MAFFSPVMNNVPAGKTEDCEPGVIRSYLKSA